MSSRATDSGSAFERGVSGVSLRSVMGAVPSAVTVVAARDPVGAPFGLTVSSFTSVSLSPPLVLVCVGNDASTHDHLVASGGFTVNVLAGDQEHLASRFSTSPSERRFEDVMWREAASGNPLLEGAAAWVDCELHRVVAAGDHSILLGLVVDCGTLEGSALLFHRGVFAAVGG